MVGMQDILGLVVEKSRAGVGLVVFMSLRKAAGHEGRAQSGVAVSVYRWWYCRGKASSCTN